MEEQSITNKLKQTRRNAGSRKRSLTTKSPTDERVSPISKALVGSPDHLQDRSKVLKQVFENSRTKRLRMDLEAASIQKETKTTAGFLERQKEKIKKAVLVPLSPNVPRSGSASGKSKTPKMETKTPNASSDQNKNDGNAVESSDV